MERVAPRVRLVFLLVFAAALTHLIACRASPTSNEMVASVTVLPSTPDPPPLLVGRTMGLQAMGYTADGSPVPCYADRWRSSSTSIATVSASGLVTGVSAGMVTITATCGEATGSWPLSVYAPCRVSGTITDDAGHPIAGASVSIFLTWRSMPRAASDASGHYLIADVPQAVWQISVSKDGYQGASSQRRLDLDDNVVDFTLHPRS